jgi:hypothetical protein
LSGSITIKVEPSEGDRLRDQCAKIAAIEAHYWGELDDERLALIAIGAMGAAANICAAILQEKTPEQHKSDCDARGRSSQEATDGSQR